MLTPESAVITFPDYAQISITSEFRCNGSLRAAIRQLRLKTLDTASLQGVRFRIRTGSARQTGSCRIIKSSLKAKEYADLLKMHERL
jgi:hypothetical protein